VSRSELTFNIVDDLAEAYLRHQLGAPSPGQSFVPIDLGPLMELALQSSNGRIGPLLGSAWVARSGHAEFRQHLASHANRWFDNANDTGFQRTTFNPLDEGDDAVRTGFLLAASRAAQRAGYPLATAQTLAAAIREMESNVHEHAELTETGILAFHAQPSVFEFVVADCGVGVLATLHESPDYPDLNDHGVALQEVLKPGVSRYGRGAHRGNGFRDLFNGLASLNADLRFRSGDHALTISGPHPELKTARLAQKPFFQGFAASVRCALTAVPHTLH
jgi:hypothetical protein